MTEGTVRREVDGEKTRPWHAESKGQSHRRGARGQRVNRDVCMEQQI